ncbi:MAG: AAA family ATPase [Desulfobacteraceae bacterium]|nr:AAA family ATPase [Desulfobacteraceae bacterium]
MKEKSSGILISENRKLRQELAGELMPIVDITDRISDISKGYATIREKKTDLVFLDVSRQENDILNLAGRIKKIQPQTDLFMINSRKDPDLLLRGFRMGITDFLTYPFDNAELAGSVRRALDGSGGISKSADIFPVFSLKGGIGVTSTAINLADHIHDLTRDRVLLLDLNLFMGDISGYLNIDITYTPYDLIKDMERMDENLLFSSLFQHPNGFYILTTPEEISDSDQVTANDIMHMLSLLEQHFDYIVIDCPHDFSDRTLEVCTRADRVLVMTQQNIPTVKSALKVIEFFRELNFDKKKIQVIINRYLKKNDMDDVDLEKIFRQKIFSTIDNNYPLFSMAANQGKTLNQADKKGKINNEMKALAGNLTGIKPHEEKDWKKIISGGLLG